jgi:alanyl-tRNA synthetase
MTSLEIRHKFFKFFADRGHTQVPSSSLIPAQDPTILFTNAGMNQFKDVFLGLEKRSYTCAVTIQKCVRAGGKHNDLENVGFTARHLTFFEMMGNFSFGDYFKKEAIIYAWEFLTKIAGIAPDNLHATVYRTDDEAYDIWHTHIGIPTSRMHRLGEKDNFWQMGDLGPCGPCSEIHLDRGPSYGCTDISECGPACDCDRFLELWNLVFMQYDRQPDGSLIPLAQTGVDTGMGLERLCAVLQKVPSVYGTDLFMPIIRVIEHITGRHYAQESALNQAAFHVLADHIRSSSLLIADGCTPSNDGRGYVLRKIIRRAALFAQKIGTQKLFEQLVEPVISTLGAIYPELEQKALNIRHIIASEVEKFATNLTRGQQLLNQYVQAHSIQKVIPGIEAFKLYDTYGFPLELIKVMADERGWTVDLDGFADSMKKQQEQSGKKTADVLDHLPLEERIKTEFTGYNELETHATISALIVDHQVVETVPADTDCWIIANRSPFFIVGGGQVPDEGWITIEDHKVPIQQLRYINGRIAALIKAPLPLEIGIHLLSTVNREWRHNAMKNHTATHLLQAALMEVVGSHIKQAGSLVHPDYLRFDFSYHENLSAEQLKEVERIVNAKIQEDIPVSIEYGSLKDAQQKGALAFFGEKYNPEQVRMVIIPHFSIELCGGTHVHCTGQIGVFKITEVSALSAGTRRIVAVTGPKAVALFQEMGETIKYLTQEFKVKREEIVPTIVKQKELIKETQTQITRLKQMLITSMIPSWLKQQAPYNSVPFLFVALDTMTEDMRTIATELMKSHPGFYFILGTAHHKQTYVATISAEYAHKVPLKEFATWLNTTHHLQGGGSAQLLQGSARTIVDPESLKRSIIDYIQSR